MGVSFSVGRARSGFSAAAAGLLLAPILGSALASPLLNIQRTHLPRWAHLSWR